MHKYRELLNNKKRIVVKIGSSSITHEITGNINYKKLDELVRILCDIMCNGKGTECAGTFGVHASFWDHFTVEVR